MAAVRLPPMLRLDRRGVVAHLLARGHPQPRGGVTAPHPSLRAGMGGRERRGARGGVAPSGRSESLCASTRTSHNGINAVFDGLQRLGFSRWCYLGAEETTAIIVPIVMIAMSKQYVQSVDNSVCVCLYVSTCMMTIDDSPDHIIVAPINEQHVIHSCSP